MPVNHSGSLIGTVWLAGNGGTLAGFLLETVLSLIGCLVLTALVALYFPAGCKRYCRCSRPHYARHS